MCDLFIITNCSICNTLPIFMSTANYIEPSLHPHTYCTESGVATEDLDNEKMLQMYTQSERGRFTHADADEDGLLDKQELKAILFPHHHDHMVDHMVQVSHRTAMETSVSSLVATVTRSSLVIMVTHCLLPIAT